MRLPRRRFLQIAAGAAALPAAARMASAQAYPSRPITMIVPFPAGGATDTFGRLLGERMRDFLGQTIVVENVGGAAGSLGVGRAVRAAPDGHTLIIGTSTRNSLPVTNLNELIAWLKANPDKASAGIAGVGATGHVTGLAFQQATGTRFQFVPYRGNAPAMQDLIAGQIDLMIEPSSNFLAQ